MRIFAPTRTLAIVFLGGLLAAVPVLDAASAAAPPATASSDRAPAAAEPEEPSPAEAWNEQIVVTATRADQPLAEVPLHALVIEGAELAAGPEYGMIDVMRRIPGLSLQGTESTLVSTPIDGGAAFRGLGGTAQSRVLLMVDSTPINDPFASYLVWTRVPAEAVDRVEIVPGSVGAWGNLALTGIVNVITRGAGDRTWGAELSAGNYGTYDAGADFSTAGRKWSGWISGSALDTDGYLVAPPAAIGPLDEPAGKRFHTLYGRLERSFGGSSSLRLAATVFDEDRRRGTPLDREESTENAVTATWDRVLAGGSSVQLHGYFRSVGLEENATAIDAARTSEAPDASLDVTSNAWGASAIWSSRGSGRHLLHVGVDAQGIAVEATRLYGWDGGAFTRSLRTEGDQRFAGAYVQDVFQVSERTTVTAGGRFDWISTEGGLRIERDRESGAVIATTSIPSQTLSNFNPALGVTHALDPRTRLRGAVYTGFRAGTPNELFIDSVGFNRNVSNPDLSPEKLVGGEFGVDWTPSRRAATRATAYLSESRDLIERVQIGRAGPQGGVIEPCGLLQPLARCRQRRNLGEVRVYGLDLEQELRFAERWRMNFLGSWLRSEITASPGNESVVGNSVLTTPEKSATVALRYDGERLAGALRVRYLGERWGDTANTEYLPAQTLADLSGELRLADGWWLTAGVQNLLDDRWIVSYSSSVPAYSSPRLYHAGIRVRAH